MDQPAGFSFDLVKRNAMLADKGMQFPRVLKTGTTIVGVCFKDGVVLGADTRSTEGPIVADKNCQKIHYIQPNIYCCGAGTAADTEFTTEMISSQLNLHKLQTNREVRVDTALAMLKQYLFKYQGHVSAALILGGVDFTGPSLYTVYPHGSTDKLPFVTMGSGSMAAMNIFEARFKPGMSRQEAIDLVADGVQAGIFNDLGSGSNVDVTVLEKGKTEVLRNYQRPNERGFRSKVLTYAFPPGTTRVLTKELIPLEKRVDIVDVVEEKMDTS
jgi:20S proteasome subunit beta 2